MAYPQPWVILSLREALDEDSFAAKTSPECRVSDGLAFPGELLGSIERTPWPRELTVDAVAKRPFELGPATLFITGGSNELARERHQQTPEFRAQVEAEVEAHRAAIGMMKEPHRPECLPSIKLRRLVRLVRDLAPFVSAVILPESNGITMSIEEFVERSASYIADDLFCHPLFSFLAVHGGVLASTGMSVFALPNLAMANDGTGEAGALLGRLTIAMIEDSWWPLDGQTFEGHTLRAVWDHVWIETPGEDARERRMFERLAQMQKIMRPLVHHHDPGEVSIEHFLRRGMPPCSITNGLSEGAQAVELSLNGQCDNAGDYLDRVAGAFDQGRDVKPYDRVVLGDGPFPAVIPWPIGHLNPFGASRLVEIWDLLPILPDELATFRADPAAQGAWIDERVAKGDFAAITSRWR